MDCCKWVLENLKKMIAWIYFNVIKLTFSFSFSFILHWTKYIFTVHYFKLPQMSLKSPYAASLWLPLPGWDLSLSLTVQYHYTSHLETFLPCITVVCLSLFLLGCKPGTSFFFVVQLDPNHYLLKRWSQRKTPRTD